MERDSETQSQTLDGAWEYYGKAGRNSERPEEDRESAGRPTESPILDSWVLPEIEFPTNE